MVAHQLSDHVAWSPTRFIKTDGISIYAGQRGDEPFCKELVLRGKMKKWSVNNAKKR